MLVGIGDVHGEIDLLNEVLRTLPESATVIQVGDFGFWPWVRERLTVSGTEVCRPIYVIDGNHEWFPWLTPLRKPTELWPNVTYVPRGTVLTLAGRRIGFLGGGDSPDSAHRVAYKNWFPDEQVRYQDRDRLLRAAAGGLDLLVTHVPPTVAKMALWPGLGMTISEQLVQDAWERLNRPPLMCGHMHPEEVRQYETVTVLPAVSYSDTAEVNPQCVWMPR